MSFTTQVLTDKLAYLPTDTVIATVETINTSSKSITLTFYTGQKYDFVITNKNGKAVFRWSDGMRFTQIVTKKVLNPKDKLTFSEKLQIEPKKLKAGEYTLEGTITAKNIAADDEKAFSTTLTAKTKITILSQSKPLIGFIYRKVKNFGKDSETPAYYLESIKGEIYELLKDNPKYKLDEYLEQFVRAWPNHFKVIGNVEDSKPPRIAVKEIQPTDEI